jgi:hypothetical protein
MKTDLRDQDGLDYHDLPEIKTGSVENLFL